ncbi:hypothetical protein D917_00650 [Trichinella nativa]|uniref:Secreted protein n=1 Tax=Trichinella nativa TaxID=6335 RepID=A0A1Y3E7I4_9BILA|nr:hypothetical protein D917_00650 [Trichinella nativa]
MRGGNSVLIWSMILVQSGGQLADSSLDAPSGDRPHPLYHCQADLPLTSGRTPRRNHPTTLACSRSRITTSKIQ